jgi:threonine/homoserine/homoserine lactone efflux protein
MLRVGHNQGATMAEAVYLGALIGVGAALSVGPIFITIVHEAITRGPAAGLKVILGSAVGDLLLLLPAVFASWLITRLQGLALVVGALGGIYFVWLGILAARQGRRLWRGGATHLEASTTHGWSFARGLLGNVLNPLSWVFWLATGTPSMLRLYDRAGWPGLLVFTVVLFGAAMGVAQTRRALTARTLAACQAVAAVVFLALAANLLLSSRLAS